VAEAAVAKPNFSGVIALFVARDVRRCMSLNIFYRFFQIYNLVILCWWGGGGSLRIQRHLCYGVVAILGDH